jgi:hypothetical protein
MDVALVLDADGDVERALIVGAELTVGVTGG